MANSQNNFIEMEACLHQDPQKLLNTAFEKRDFENFLLALSKGANPQIIITPAVKMSIFEKSCQTPGCHEYIKACLDHGCDVNKYNKDIQKRPINFAAESMSSQNIKALLTKPEIDVDFQWNSLTPIHRIIKHMDEKNADQVFDSIIHLVTHNANVNIPDKKLITPITTLARKKVSRVQQIIKYLLESTNVDIDSHRNGEARNLITKLFPYLTLPIPVEKVIDFYHLIGLIKSKKEDQFKIDLEKFMLNSDNYENKRYIFLQDDGEKTLLEFAVEEGLLEIVRSILSFGADVNYAKSKYYSPIGLACLNGRNLILEYFLSLPEIEINNCADPLLCIVIKKLGDSNDSRYQFCHFTKCFNILTNVPEIDVNEKDVTGCTALHYAVKYKNDDAILSLLKRSAYIGMENQFNDIPIGDIDPYILEQYFDSCITTNNRRPGDHNYEIIFDYSCLNPTLNVTALDSKVADNSYIEEMKPIEYMAKTSELRYLIKHPLISSFLWLKWHRLGMIFYTNFFLYSLFCISFILYVVCCYERDISKHLSTFLYIFSVLGVIYVIIRETIQFLMSPGNYFKTFENYIELSLITVTIVILCGDQFDKEDQRVIAAIAILLVAAEFSLLVGSLPIMSISTHMVMLKTVSISFMKSLMLYSIIIISFALSFYKLIGSKDQAKKDVDQSENLNITSIIKDSKKKSDEDSEEEFNHFISPGTAIIKTIVMLTGEYEAANIDFENSFTSYVIFLLFVFFISIVLLNLLNGLAVNDTQTIKSEAELTGFIYRAELLSRYEKIKLGKLIHKFKTVSPISLFPDFLPISKLILMPNDNNNVYIPQQINKKSNKSHVIEFNYEKFENKPINSPIKPLVCCFCNRRCSRMDSEILKYATKVLGNKIHHDAKLREKEDLKRRICRIEECVDSMEKLLREIILKKKNITT